MLKNHGVHIIATYALLILASPLIFAENVGAQAVNCPVGYICTPVSSTGANAGGYANKIFSNGYYYGGGYTNNNAPAVTSASPCYFFTNNLACGGATTQPIRPIITVISPNGQSWPMGSTRTIRWTDSAHASRVYYTVYITSQNGSTYGVAANQVYGTSFAWTVGSFVPGSTSGRTLTPGNTYYIQVIRRTLPFANSGNSPFTVSSVISSVIPSNAIISACPINATAKRGQNGKSFTCHCASIGTSSVWGTNRYTDGSNICAAAKHAGWTMPGNVTYTIQPGQTTYTGSLRNGLTSSSYSSWLGTFVIEPL